MKNTVFLIISITLFSCDTKTSESYKIRVVKRVNEDLLSFRLDSLKKYSSDSIVLKFGNIKIPPSDVIAYLEKNLADQKEGGTKFDSVRYVSNSDQSIKVTYKLRNWIGECLGNSEYICVDIYSVENGKIIEIEQSVLNQEIADSISIANQRLFFKWAESYNYEIYTAEGSINQDKFFYYLRKYCNQKSDSSNSRSGVPSDPQLARACSS